MIDTACLEHETILLAKRMRTSADHFAPVAKRARPIASEFPSVNCDAKLPDVPIGPTSVNIQTAELQMYDGHSVCTSEPVKKQNAKYKAFECSSLNLQKGEIHCPMAGCCKTYTRTKSMYAHFRNCHALLVNEKGGCIKFGIPDKMTKEKSIYIPREISCEFDISSSQYAFLKKMVNRNLTHDYAKYKHNCVVATVGRYEKYGEETFLKNNTEKHGIVQSIMYYIIDLNLLEKNAIDEAGGCVEGGLSMEAHSGVFGLSLDRKDHRQPHFPDPENPLANIRIIATGLNTHVNLVEKYGPNTCSYIRREMQRELTKDELDRSRDRESRKTIPYSNKRHTTSYESCKSIFCDKTKSGYRDTKCRNQFLNIDTFWKFAIGLWYSQNMRCAISGILLQGADAQEPFFKMSLDAINPCKGHVKGNLRWICQGLNSTNTAKLMKSNQEYDPDTNTWTKQKFRAYVGLL